MHLRSDQLPEVQNKDRDRALAVSEIFGPTIQGEGPDAGQRCMFLRLAGCNLACSWCDTPYTWDWTGRNGTAYDTHQEIRIVSIFEIADILWKHRKARRLVVSGGEPMLQQEKLAMLLSYQSSWTVEIETNGTIEPGLAIVPFVTRFNVSPKLAHSQNVARGFNPIILPALRRFLMTGKAILKFVCETTEDFKEIDGLLLALDMPDLDPLVWIMPQARSYTEMNEKAFTLGPAAIERGWNITSRMQLALWGANRGH